MDGIKPSRYELFGSNQLSTEKSSQNISRWTTSFVLSPQKQPIRISMIPFKHLTNRTNERYKNRFTRKRKL